MGAKRTNTRHEAAQHAGAATVTAEAAEAILLLPVVCVNLLGGHGESIPGMLCMSRSLDQNECTRQHAIVESKPEREQEMSEGLC